VCILHSLPLLTKQLFASHVPLAIKIQVAAKDHRSTQRISCAFLAQKDALPPFDGAWESALHISTVKDTFTCFCRFSSA